MVLGNVCFDLCAYVTNAFLVRCEFFDMVYVAVIFEKVRFLLFVSVVFFKNIVLK